jgi:hypothetical protein
VRCRRFSFCTCRGGKARNEWPFRHLSGSSTTPNFDICSRSLEAMSPIGIAEGHV